MKVAVIGPGRVGGALALALQRAGHDVVAVTGRTPDASSVTAFRQLIPTAAVLPAAQASAAADLVLLTTPDDDIVPVARQVAAADGVREGQRWVHTAGGKGPDALSVITAAGGRVAACHPAMTFPDARTGADRLPGAAWAVTAAEQDLDWARLLVLDLHGSPVTVAAKDRTLYHAGLAVGSNGTTAVVALARDLLLGAGVEVPEAFLRPLTTASAEGAAGRGIEALTGPVARGDAGTVAAHLRELRTAFPEVVDTYLALARLMLAQAERRGLDADRVAEVRALLDGLA